jgi:hypothetical protein
LANNFALQADLLYFADNHNYIVAHFQYYMVSADIHPVEDFDPALIHNYFHILRLFRDPENNKILVDIVHADFHNFFTLVYIVYDAVDMENEPDYHSRSSYVLD